MLANPPPPEPHPERREPRKGAGKVRLTCRSCGTPGHFLKDCPNPRRETRERHLRGEVGYLAANCRQSGKGKRALSAGAAR
eukprot:15463531-Alexandrium_andersonii.AAC.1